ncbi:MAG TPA: acyltransferase family protein [Hyphomicrobiaceae bacterium]|nr:acyltransferase family protein [Hyphomicrobiaceae bacterium]
MHQQRAVFRRDIEALRAISVLAVVLFHMRVPGFGGGFAGVDVFFVISGFLISGQLLRERESTGGIDLLAFWSRRAWRLLPNALLVLSVTAVVAAFIMSADQTGPLALDIASASVYMANYRFATRAIDYFDNAQHASPVLHFWSLSVEEQFYLIWPCLLLLACWRAAGDRIRRRAATIAALIIIASFVASAVYIHRNQPAAFFHTEARIWQLAVGAILAVLDDRAILPERLRTLASGAGLLGILGSVTLLNERDYPGSAALVPVASAALLIAAGRSGSEAGVQRVLNLAPLQWLGSRSYSLYLWHWPILLLGKSVEFGPMEALGLMGLSIAVAATAYAVMEAPLRRYGMRQQRSVQGLAMPLAASGCIGAVAVGLAVVGMSSFNPFVSEKAQQIAQLIARAREDGPQIGAVGRCRATIDNDPRSGCRFGAPNSERTVVLFGDSYAEHLFDGMDAAAREAGWSMRIWTRAGCPPIDAPSLDSGKRVVDADCLSWRNAVVRQLIADAPRLVVVSSWSGVATNLADDSGRALSRGQSRLAWREGFASLLGRLRRGGVEVAVVRGTPRGSFSELHSCLLVGTATSDRCGRPRGNATAYSSLDLEVAATVAGVRLVDLADRFCGPNVCYSFRDGMIVYRDRHHHLTAAFSRSLSSDFKRLLQDVELGR